MSINIADNMAYNGKKPLDARISYATLALMKAVTDANIYEGCEAYCVETDKYYKFKSTNTVDASTGKWRERQSGGSGGTTDYEDLNNKPSINDIELDGNKTSDDLGLASKENMDKAYKSDDTAFTDIADGDYIPVYDTSETTKKKSLWSNIKDKLKAYFDTLYDLNKSDIPFYATSSTGASTTAKTATVSRGTFTLVAGAKVTVKFTYTNTASAPTLNVGSTGAKNIKYIDSDGTVTTPTTWWGAGEVVTFVYDGTQWLMMPTISMIPSLPVVGTMSKSDLYSTTEKVVGMWTDGRPVYQKVFTGTMPSTSSDGTLITSYITTGVSINEVVNRVVFLKNSNGTSIYLNDSIPTSSTSVKYARCTVLTNSSSDTTNKNKIALSNAIASWSSMPVTIILQYTKTTDSANSYNYSSENEYSTSEKIVGTWIDGSYLYQKTIAITLPNASGSEEVGTWISTGTTVKLCVSCTGYILNSGNRTIPLGTVTASGTARAIVGLSNYSANANKIGVFNSNINWNGATGYVTIQYTKT